MEVETDNTQLQWHAPEAETMCYDDPRPKVEMKRSKQTSHKNQKTYQSRRRKYDGREGKEKLPVTVR